MTDDQTLPRCAARCRERGIRTALLSALLVAAPAIVSACTVCDSDSGEQVRAGIFSDDFWSTMLAVLAPFVATLSAGTLLQFALFRDAKPTPPKTSAPSPSQS
jgi:hypothetical protein